MKHRKQESGFTLVELAIVMVIVGLLIAGVLKGQEMIANAQVTSTISQIKAFDAAASTFRDAYGALAGDMINANVRLVNCAASPCTNGNGNGRINVNVGAGPALGGEGVDFFNHLRAADLVAGFDGTNVLAFGNALPAAAVGGGFTVGHSLNGVTGFNAAEFRPGHYLVVTGTTGGVAVGTGVLTNTQAARIDRKLDDGVPNTGSVVSQNTGGTCRIAAAGAIRYNENIAAQTCALAIRIQG